MKKNPNRREFMKTSALLTGGLLAPSFLVPGAYAAPQNTLKLALIGCGGRGTGAVFQAFDTGHPIKLVAMADAFGDRLEGSYKPIIEKYGKDKVDVPQERRFVGFDAYKKAIAEADVVILASPPGFRPSHFEEAVRQGKQIFMEKPVATDAAGIRKVLAAAEVAKAKKTQCGSGLAASLPKQLSGIHEAYSGRSPRRYCRRTGVLERWGCLGEATDS